MNLMLPRRGFLGVSAGALASWMTTGARSAEAGNAKRVGLIGSGWYGKCDLLRLLQVAPVEVVALCDVDRPALEQGHISSACCILANLADDLDRTPSWDTAAHEVSGDDEANRRLARLYREPWKHPAA